MRVSFPRLADGRRAYSVVDRADGVRYRVREGVAGSDVPHDLVHFIVERETGERGGFWGAVADGAVFASMEHVDGRRPPHAARRSSMAVAERKDRLLPAELMAGLVSWVAEEQVSDPARVVAAAREQLSTLPHATVDAGRVIKAAGVLRDVARQWAALRIGEELVMEWPGNHRALGKQKRR